MNEVPEKGSTLSAILLYFLVLGAFIEQTYLHSGSFAEGFFFLNKYFRAGIPMTSITEKRKKKNLT